MKLVLKYTTTDECTFSCDNTVPFYYESAEQFLFDLELACENYTADLNKALDWKTKPRFAFSNVRATFRPVGFGDALDLSYFVESDGSFNAPQVFSVFEWFEKYAGTPELTGA